MNKGSLICWDTSVLISWIGGKSGDGEDRVLLIRPVVEGVENGLYRLAASALLYVELLERTMSEEIIDKFNKFLQNKEKIEIIAVDIRVAKKAQAVRNKTSIKTPDAIHIATAIVSGAKEFHTFDKQLISFSGKDEVEGLAITNCKILGANRTLF